MEAYGDPLDCENAAGSCESQLREDLAEAMLEISIASQRAPGKYVNLKKYHGQKCRSTSFVITSSSEAIKRIYVRSRNLSRYFVCNVFQDFYFHYYLICLRFTLLHCILTLVLMFDDRKVVFSPEFIKRIHFWHCIYNLAKLASM